MTFASWSVCGSGEHDLTDPANVGSFTRPGGATGRYCKPCNHRRSRDRRHRLRAAAAPQRTGQRPPRRSALGYLQAVADGSAVPEIADELGLSLDAVYSCLARLRHSYGVASTAAAVLAALIAGDVQPVRGQPLPPRGSNSTRDHRRDLERLLRGERLPRTQGVAFERMMDDLYAFSEAHAVSVLVAARVIPSMKKEAA